MNSRNLSNYVLIGVVAFVLSIGVGYATFNATIKINGTATVKASSWKVKFDNLSEVNKTGTAEVIDAPVIENDDDTHIGDYKVSLTTPGDSISYTFDVVNEGTFDAEISSLIIGSPVCEGTATDEAQAKKDAANVCSNLTYTLTYADGTDLIAGDKLASGNTKSLKMTITYNSDTDASELPTNDVSISGLDSSIIYTQS